MQRRHSVRVPRVHIGSLGDEQFGHFPVAIQRREMQGGHSLVVAGVQVSALVDEQRSGFLSAGAGRIMQGSRTPIIPRIHIRARGQVQPDSFDVTLPRSLMNRDARRLDIRLNQLFPRRRLQLPGGTPHKESGCDDCDDEFVPFDLHLPYKSEFDPRPITTSTQNEFSGPHPVLGLATCQYAEKNPLPTGIHKPAIPFAKVVSRGGVCSAFVHEECGIHNRLCRSVGWLRGW